MPLPFAARTLVALPLFALSASFASADDVAPTETGPSLSIEGVSVSAEQAQPEACFSFNLPLAQKPAAELTPYLADSSGASLTGRITGHELCLSGLAHGTSTTITLREGLESAAGATLATTQTRDVTIPDRTPQLKMLSNGSILPSGGNLGIPIRSVNMTELSARLVRLHPENLQEFLPNLTLGFDVSRWDVTRIAQDEGEQVWSGKIDLSDAPRNADHSVLLPLQEMAGKLEPGAYLIYVTGAKRQPVEYEWRDLATVSQWVVVTDIGLTAIKAEDGLAVLARSLETADARPRLTVELRAYNDKVLGTATTDIYGRVKFAPELLAGTGGNRPRSIHARQGDDFAVLNLDSTIDLTRLGIEGGDPVGDLDLHLFAERGIWRAGETAYLTGLLRNRTGAALDDAPPLALKLLRPDGQEFSRHSLQPGHGGAVSLDIEFPATAPAGRWQVTAHLGQDGPEIGRIELQVRDFVPPRLAVYASADDAAVKPGETLEVAVQADYFHGAPGANLGVSGEFTVTADPKPFGDRWQDTLFGVLSEEVEEIRAPVDGGKTDSTGAATLQAPVPDLVDVTRPLKYTLTTEVTDIDGRPARDTVERAFVRDGEYLGIKPGFEDRAPLEQEVGFELVLVDQDGTAQSNGKIDWVVRELRYDWLWRQDQGNWSWQRVTHRGQGPVVARGNVDSSVDGLVTVTVPSLDWGRYEIEAFAPESGAIAAYEFAAGWSRLASEADTPEQIRVEIDEAGSSDDTIRAFVQAPYAGEVSLILTDGRIHSMSRRDVPAEGAFIEVPKSTLQRPGGWLMAMAWRGFGDASKGQFLPRRAMGAAWVDHQSAKARLSARLVADEVLKPREQAKVTLQVDGLAEGETAHAVVMAVDEGVLRMTRHDGPGLLKHYLDPRRPALTLHDHGGRLIDASGLNFAALKQGGDDEMDIEGARAIDDQLSGLPVRAYKVVALSSGPVTLDASGKAEVTFDMPDVNTGLRLSAAVWTQNRLGEARLDVKLRDPVLLELTRPLFMAPGDIADVVLALNVTDGAAGTYSAALSATGPVVISPATISFGELARQSATQQPVTLSAPGGIGAATLFVSLTGPDGFTLKREFDLGVRPASPLVTERRSQVMVQGQASRLDPAQYANRFVPGTLTADLTLTGVPDFGSKALLRSLNRYPYGCTEQTTSKAMPLLVYADRAAEYGLADQAQVRARIQSAISSLSARQASDGSFGIWSNRSTGNIWLTSYVLDFLGRARSDGFVVPTSMVDRAQTYLARRAFSEDRDEAEDYAATAYSAQVLASTGRTDLLSLDRLRWWADARGAVMPGTLAPAQLGSALAALGDQQRATRLFDEALGSSREARLWLADYGSPLRDRAAVLALAAESGVVLSDRLAELAVTLDRDASRRQWLSTQEKSWLLMAARALADSGAEAELSLNGEAMTLTGGERLSRRLMAGDDALMARNLGESQLVSSLAITGIPLQPLPAAQNGYSITRGLFTPSGEPLDGNRFERGQSVVVVIEAMLTDASLQRESLIVDMLPAGLEPELVAVTPGLPGYDWVSRPDLFASGTDAKDSDRVYLTTPTHRELRDDRFVAALQMGKWQQRVRLAYQLRAVTPGTFAAPGVFIEDMYAPETHARGETTTIVVAPAE